MQDVMRRLQDIVEAGYDNEDMQRGITAAATQNYEVSEEDNKLVSEISVLASEDDVSEGTEMGTIGDVAIKQFGAGDGRVGVQLTGPDGYVQLSMEETTELAGRLGRWAAGIDKPQQGEYDESVSEDDVEEVHEVDGQSGVLGLVSESVEADEAVVSIPVQELTDIMKLAGYDNYAEKIEEYANEPDETYMDAEEQLVGLSGGLNSPKSMHPTAAGGDNAMAVRALDVEEIGETFYQKYNDMIDELKTEEL